MIYFKYLFHNLKDLSPNEGIVFSELLFHSLVSNPDYKSGELFNIELAKDEMRRYKELQWVEYIRYYSMDYPKIMQHTEMSFPTVKKLVKSLHDKSYIGTHTISCPYNLLVGGYIKVPYNTDLKGRELLLYSLLVDRTYQHGHTVDTWAYKLAELCGIQEGHVYKIINHLKRHHLLERQEDGRLRVFKPRQPSEMVATEKEGTEELPPW